MRTYHEIASSPEPQRAVRELADGWLCQLIDDLRALEKVNDFQARVFALAMSEAVRRWRSSGIEEGAES